MGSIDRTCIAWPPGGPSCCAFTHKVAFEEGSGQNHNDIHGSPESKAYFWGVQKGLFLMATPVTQQLPLHS